MQDTPAALIERAPAAFEALSQPSGARTQFTLPDGFVYLDEAAPGIAWDAKYATSDNFTGAPVDGYAANRIAISQAACASLKRAQAIAQSLGYALLVWDAARPQRAVDRFVAWVQEPETGLTKAAHYPSVAKSDMLGEYIAAKSGHSRGCSVDLTLIDGAGNPLDMGGCFDLMDEISHHGAKGLTQAQTDNRNLLKDIMTQAGFKAYKSEWWHYALADEPFPDQYFDFEIGWDVLA